MNRKNMISVIVAMDDGVGACYWVNDASNKSCANGMASVAGMEAVQR